MFTLLAISYLILTTLTALGYWKSYSKDGVLRNRIFGTAVFILLFAPLCGLYWLASCLLALSFFIVLRSESLLQRVVLDRIFGRRQTERQEAMQRTRQQLRKMGRQQEKQQRRAARAGVA